MSAKKIKPFKWISERLHCVCVVYIQRVNNRSDSSECNNKSNSSYYKNS